MARRNSHRVARAVAAFFARQPQMAAQPLLLGLSGGPDSVALLHALLALAPAMRPALYAAHYNHDLRHSAARDENFVRELCARLGVPLQVGHACDLAGSNLEARARQARYRYLTEAAERVGAAHIAVAHQAEDQAETVLMRLLRGAGVTGLGAMAPVGPGRLVRPLLEVRRAEILDYLAAIGANYVEDDSNASLVPERNRVRLRLIPLLETDFSPGLSARLCALAAEMRSVGSLLESLADQFLSTATDAHGDLEIERLQALPQALALAALRAYVERQVGSLSHFDRSHFEALYRLCIKGKPNGRLDLPGGWRGWRQYGRLRIVGQIPAKRSLEFERELHAGARVDLAGLTIEAWLRPAVGELRPRSEDEALFDADVLEDGLRVRNCRPGDRIVPLGMRGRRKLNRIFIERRVAPALRAGWPLLVWRDEVVWLPGLVRSNAALVSARTKRVLQVRMSVAPNLNRVLASR
ncbi:MAG TPA: tRNA lysidine(34) synthetase TilS [Candidatus Binataceae bacterium]|nr:tRNA lysidine(34) synthetase TilS [Candidatus Binataceae bacterium]